MGQECQFDISAGPLLGPVLKWYLGSTVDSDTVDLTDWCKGFFCTVSGNVRFHDPNGNELTFPVTAGTWYNWAVRRLFVTNTTATIYLGR